MKIIIDTKQDTKEEIAKIAKLLQELGGAQPQQEFTPQVGENAFAMFEEKPAEKQPFNISKLIEYD